MRTAVPHNIVQNIGNAGISLILDNDPVIRCGLTLNTGRCIIGKPFADPPGNLVTEEENEGEDPNLDRVDRKSPLQLKKPS
jgi:hypothetical protein